MADQSSNGEGDARGGISRWIRHNVLGLIAIFIALSGTAVATQVADRDATIAAKSKAKKGPRGPAGPAGPAGPQGQQGLQGPVGPSTGAAGGDLTGNFPNPEIAAGAVGTAEHASGIPAVHATLTADQSIPDATQTALALDSELYDTATMHDNATQNSRLTAPVTGIYAVTARVAWDSDADGVRALSILRNGAVEVAQEGDEGVLDGTRQTAAGQTRLLAGDYLELLVTHTAGNALDVLAFSESLPEFAMVWVAPG